MKKLPKTKLQTIEARHEEILAHLASPDIAKDPKRLQKLSKEQAQLSSIVEKWEKVQTIETQTQEAQTLLKEEDAELANMAKEELNSLKAEMEKTSQELLIELLPKDPEDACSIYLEVRAGTGGDEACLFAGDLFRMYQRYAETQGWSTKVVDSHEGDHGGYKSIVASVEGKSVYAKLKFESGTHRVQRIPETESQGRIHTSACTVAILPQVQAIESVTIDLKTCRVDTYRSSGAGGQHVNTTDSAVRITHLPTGIVAECQDERSQHKNKARAINLLQAKILDVQRQSQHQEQSDRRRLQVGTGDRSGRIRTYNFPQGRITDHRIQSTWHQLSDILNGELSAVIQALQQDHYTALLTELKDD
jgi:peptide chain release factor 1